MYDSFHGRGESRFSFQPQWVGDAGSLKILKVEVNKNVID